MPKRRKKNLDELPDDKLLKPINISFVEDGINSKFIIRLHPQAAEIIEEAKRRGLNDIKRRKFRRKGD